MHLDLISKGLTSDLIRLLVDNTPIAYIILDDQFRIHYINDYFLKLRKLDMKSTLGERCYNISNGGRRCENCAVEQALKRGEKAFVSRKDILQDGTVRYIDDYASPLYHDPKTGTQYILEIMVNRTQEMQARESRDADYEEILAILSSLLEAKDHYTAAHSDSVRRIAVKLARAMGLPEREVRDISIAATLHDIGKVRVPDPILNKPARLTDDEFDVIKRHPIASYELICELSSFANIQNIVKYHHERVDGQGYPDGLKMEEIPLGARIVAVADTYDAITSTRSYRTAQSHESAIREMMKASGTQLDAHVLEVFSTLDFEFDLNEECKQCDACAVERKIESIPQAPDEMMDWNTYQAVVGEDRLLQGIFEHTPCGYVVMNTERKVIFASEYFLRYMGLTQDEVLGQYCYIANQEDQQPCKLCAIERALQTGQVEYMRQEQQTRNGLKIFDSFGMPLRDESGQLSHVIEVTLDRTEEVLMERQREQDLTKLIDRMGDLLMDDGAEMRAMSAKIVALRQRLARLLEKLNHNQTALSDRMSAFLKEDGGKPQDLSDQINAMHEKLADLLEHWESPEQSGTVEKHFS